MDERPIEEAQPRRRGRPVLTRVALVAVLVLVIAVIVFTIVITGIYVRRANSEFDELTAAIRARAQA